MYESCNLAPPEIKMVYFSRIFGGIESIRPERTAVSQPITSELNQPFDPNAEKVVFIPTRKAIVDVAIRNQHGVIVRNATLGAGITWDVTVNESDWERLPDATSNSGVEPSSSNIEEGLFASWFNRTFGL